jgi:hypothetical protein
MSNSTFSNGLTLQSSSLTPEAIATIFQAVTIQILGLPLTPPSVAPLAYKSVRVGWQQTGQPAWKIDEDTAIITAYPEDDPYSKVRDQSYDATPNLSPAINQNMSYTQVWKIHWTFYGPNAFDHARLLVSSMSLDWVYDYLKNPPPPANTQIYALASWDRPRYVPELFQGQWWQRADVDLKFNELVKEEYVAATALSQEVILTPDVGPSETVEIVT